MKRYRRLFRNLCLIIIFMILIDKVFEKNNIVNNLKDILVLVNYENQIPNDYEPSDLVVPNIEFTFKEDHPKKQMRKEAALAIEEMFDAAMKDGVKLYGVSGYRSFERQREIFLGRVLAVGEKKAKEYVAQPGESEHQTGLAMDIGNLEENFGDSTEGKWVRKNAHYFGFIIRYPKGKEHITRINYEPWHIRYVGTKAAKDIYLKDLTLEEYLKENPGEKNYKIAVKDIGTKVLINFGKILHRIKSADILDSIRTLF